MHRHAVRLLPLCILLCILLAWRVTPLPAQALDKDAKVEFSYQMAPDEPEIPVRGSSVYVRPNTEHGIILHIKNAEVNKQKDAILEHVVSLMRVDTDPPVLLARTKLEKGDKLRAGDKARVKFDKALPWIGTPPKLQLWLSSKNKETVKQDLAIQFEEPERYVKVSKAHYDAKTKRISFIVSLKDGFVGPACPVQLVIHPDYFPGLKKSIKKKNLTESLTQIGQVHELFADLEFDGPDNSPVDPRVFLNIDGYERALEYRPNFNDATGNLRLAQYTTDIGVRFRTDRYLLPDPKKPHVIALEIDSKPIDRPARLEFGFNRSENNKEDGKFQIKPPGGYPGLRDIKLSVNAGKEGELLTKMTVADWKAPIELGDLSGTRWLRVRVLDADGKKELGISSEALKPLEKKMIRPGLAALVLEGKRVLADVLIDDTAVKDITFKKWPPDLYAGKPLNVVVTIEERPEDQNAPVEKAIFYLGKKSDDKIVADEQVIGTKVSDTQYSATLRTPEKEGPVEVSVQFQMANGMKSSKSDFVSLKPYMGEKVVATLKGKVLDSRERGQADVMVTLKDAKGAAKGTKKSGAMGVFVFEKVLPGDYTLEAKKAIPRFEGAAAVTVPPGKETVEMDVVIKMK